MTHSHSLPHRPTSLSPRPGQLNFLFPAISAPRYRHIDGSTEFAFFSHKYHRASDRAKFTDVHALLPSPGPLSRPPWTDSPNFLPKFLPRLARTTLSSSLLYNFPKIKKRYLLSPFLPSPKYFANPVCTCLLWNRNRPTTVFGHPSFGQFVATNLKWKSIHFVFSFYCFPFYFIRSLYPF